MDDASFSSTFPVPEGGALPSISYGIPGLDADPALCLKCRSAQLLCGKPVCPILVRYDAFARTMPMIDGRELEGSSPPGVFVGRFGYPKVSVGPLLSPLQGDTELLDTPESWVGRSVQEVVGFRTGLVRGTRPIRVLDAEKPIPYLEDLQLLAIAANSADAHAEFRRAPRGHLSLSDSAPPFGPSAPIDRMRLDVRRVDQHLERMTSDLHANARVAVSELYRTGVQVSRIQRAFSVGTLGRHGRRKLVPTRWSITAVDDLLSKENLERIRYFPELGDLRISRYVALDNRWLLVFLPGSYRYESIEVWYPNTLWNPTGNQVVMMGDHEGFHGRTTYASIGGCYYAARLATSEALLKIGRQAGVIVLREVHPGEIMPLGVWNVREHIRAALARPLEPVSGLNELAERIGSFFTIPRDRWLRQSSLLTSARTQRRLEEFDPDGRPAPAGLRAG